MRRKELIQRFFRRTLQLPRPLEHLALEAFFRLGWRKIGQCEEVVALEVRTFIKELLATFIIDHARRRVRKMCILWIAGRAGRMASQ